MKRTGRWFALLLLLSTQASGWVQSVEFPWSVYPQPLWERELVHLKNLGISHVSLPPGNDPEQLNQVIRIVRRLNLEADLEGAIPEALKPLARDHGGPLTEPGALPPLHISALAPDALLHSRSLFLTGKQAVVWTEIEDTLSAGSFHAGAIRFDGRETTAVTPVQRDALLLRYWGSTLPSVHEVPGAERQFVADNGASFIAAANSTAKPVTSDLKAVYSPLKRVMVLPGVTVPAHGSLWLPVNIPLTSGPLCKACTAFANSDHLVYATAELTAMEYENGILAMEFSAPSPGEAILQLSRQPSGPLVAGGKPAEFDWDEHTLRVRLKIPKGSGPGDHVRIGLAIEAPDATAFFQNAHVLLIGETNNLTAEFSSTAIANRSRLRVDPEMPTSQDAAKDDLELIYHVKVPANAIAGDSCDLALEADGSQMSHARARLLRPVTLQFSDAIGVRLGTGSVLPLFPASVPVNQRSGRDLTISVRNNAPEIRTFRIDIAAEGFSFSPEKMEVVVGVSAARDVTFRVFPTQASAGLHAGEVRVSGSATDSQPFQLLVIPQNEEVPFTSGSFSFRESAKYRASFLGGRWLEFLNKESGQNLLPAGGMALPAHADPGALTLRELEALAPRPVRK